MRRFVTFTGVGVLLVASAVVTQLVTHAAASPPSTKVGQQTYLTGMFTPANGTMVGGTALLISQTAATPGDRNPNAQNETNTAATLALQASGLKPAASYTLALGPNVCTSSGGAGNAGAATASTTGLPTVQANPGGDAAIVATHVGYQALPKTAVELALRASTSRSLAACAKLQAPRWIVGIKPMDGSTASGVALITPNVPVLNGMVKAGTEVVVYATGLQPNVVQPNHIHAGSCSQSSAVLFPLTTLVSNASGQAVAGTALPLSINLSAGSIHIHRANFLPEACGDLTAKTTG